MAAGTVGYTDTRGNKDYTSIIAGQIGRRLKEASNMAGEERAYAAGMAEAGGTSLEEAGVGKGSFFTRALGSRFGGDRIARTRGRMGAQGAGKNPAASYKQRFRGGFDYKVTNNTITDVAPLSNALVVGLRGVQQGLNEVGGAIQRQGMILGQLSRSQADMAKATMFNGYLFAMFQSQQKQSAGRSSLRREERSLEGGSYGGGRIGGASFGGSGGGRGMINVTGGGSGGGMGGGMGGDSSGASTSFFTSNILSSASRLGSSSLSAGKGMISAGAKSAKGYKALASGDIVGMMGSNSLYQKYGIDMGQTVAKSPDSIAMAAAKMLGLPAGQTDSLAKMVSIGSKQPKYLDDATAAAKRFGSVFAESDPAMKRVLQMKTMAEQFGSKPDKMANEMMTAVLNLREKGAMQKMGQNLKPDDALGKSLFNEYFKHHENVYYAVSKKYGQKNADQFMKFGLFSGGDAMIGGGEAAIKSNAIADSLMKHYPDMGYESFEKAILMARVGDMADKGYGSTKIIKEVRKQMGNNVADDLFLKYGDDILSNTQVMKTMAKGSGRVGLRRILKAVPGIGLGLGVIFGIQRAMKGDFLGAGLEIGSGVLGLNPATTGLGLGIDGFLLARDMGMMPMRTGGTIYPGKTNSMLNVGGRGFSFNEPGNKEVVRVEKDTDNRFIEMGEGIVEGFKKKKSDYIALNSIGVERGLRTLGSDGFFSGLFKNTKDITNNLTSPIKAIKNIPGGIKNWFMKGFRPGEDAMSWKDLLADDWKQRGKFGKGGKLGGWDITRGFRPGVPASEGGMMSGPTPAGRQSVRRLFGFLSSFRGGGFATLASMIANDFINPQPLADGTMEGYLKSVGQADTSGLAGSLGTNGIVTPTIINNNYYNNSAGKTDEGSEDATIGMGDLGMDAFMVNYSLMTK